MACTSEKFNCWRRWGRTIYVISWWTSVIPRMPQIMVVCMRRIQIWLTKDGVDSLLECLMALWWALHSFIHLSLFFALSSSVYLDALDMLSTYLSLFAHKPTINNLLTVSICHDLTLLAFSYNNFIIFENFSRWKHFLQIEWNNMSWSALRKFQIDFLQILFNKQN